jgi:hypothetical protein
MASKTSQGRGCQPRTDKPRNETRTLAGSTGRIFCKDEQSGDWMELPSDLRDRTDR